MRIFVMRHPNLKGGRPMLLNQTTLTMLIIASAVMVSLVFITIFVPKNTVFKRLSTLAGLTGMLGLLLIWVIALTEAKPNGLFYSGITLCAIAAVFCTMVIGDRRARLSNDEYDEVKALERAAQRTSDAYATSYATTSTLHRRSELFLKKGRAQDALTRFWRRIEENNPRKRKA
jgi:hypothetical protein